MAKASTKFKEGDIVKLKSGGPSMTVVEVELTLINDEQKYYCRWFAGSKVQSEIFTESSLIFSDDSKSK